jgi:hypothetical protein
LHLGLVLGWHILLCLATFFPENKMTLLKWHSSIGSLAYTTVLVQFAKFLWRFSCVLVTIPKVLFFFFLHYLTHGCPPSVQPHFIYLSSYPVAIQPLHTIKPKRLNCDGCTEVWWEIIEINFTLKLNFILSFQWNAWIYDFKIFKVSINEWLMIYFTY